MSKRKLGELGERIALQYLTQEGFALVDRNFFTRSGEIDLIVQKDALLVFVEVKWRRDESFGSAAESITWQKRQRIRATIVHYLLQHPHHGSIRMDALLLDGQKDHLHITHVRDIQ
ncbi:MAG: YraN family protein [Patescibacteria group bacterium]|jgi:putative endonuclease